MSTLHPTLHLCCIHPAATPCPPWYQQSTDGRGGVGDGVLQGDGVPQADHEAEHDAVDEGSGDEVEVPNDEEDEARFHEDPLVAAGIVVAWGGGEWRLSTETAQRRVAGTGHLGTAPEEVTRQWGQGGGRVAAAGSPDMQTTAPAGSPGVRAMVQGQQPWEWAPLMGAGRLPQHVPGRSGAPRGNKGAAPHGRPPQRWAWAPSALMSRGSSTGLFPRRDWGSPQLLSEQCRAALPPCLSFPCRRHSWSHRQGSDTSHRDYHTRPRLTHLTHLQPAGIRPSEPLGTPRTCSLLSPCTGGQSHRGPHATGQAQSWDEATEPLACCTQLRLRFPSDQLLDEQSNNSTFACLRRGEARPHPHPCAPLAALHRAVLRPAGLHPVPGSLVPHGETPLATSCPAKHHVCLKLP